MAMTREGYLFSEGEGRKGLKTAAGLDTSMNIKDTYNVVVIGAGFAGLVAARDISHRTDLSVLIVEARDRIGGRAWTAHECGQEFEVGAGWVTDSMVELPDHQPTVDRFTGLSHTFGANSNATAWTRTSSLPTARWRHRTLSSHLPKVQHRTCQQPTTSNMRISTPWHKHSLMSMATPAAH